MQHRFLQVSASDGDHTCALLTSGLPTCFGLNNYGQATLPSTVATSPQELISTGRYHTCCKLRCLISLQSLVPSLKCLSLQS